MRIIILFILNFIFQLSYSQDLLRLELSGNNSTDETIVYFNTSTSDTFNQNEDVIKIFSTLPGIPSLYTIIDSHPVCINAMHMLSENKTIQLGIRSQMSTSYQIRASEISSFIVSSGLYLEDLYLDSIINFRLNTTYDFQLPVGNIQNRFLLHFSPPVIVESIQSSCNNDDGIIAINYNSIDSIDISIEDEYENLILNLNNFSGQFLIDSLSSGLYKVFINFSDWSAIDYTSIEHKNTVSVKLNSSQTNISLHDSIVFWIDNLNGINNIWIINQDTICYNRNTLSKKFNESGSFLVTVLSYNEECISSDSLLITVNYPTGYYNLNSRDKILVVDDYLQILNTHSEIRIIDTMGKIVRTSLDGRIYIGDLTSSQYIINYENIFTRVSLLNQTLIR